MNSIVIVNDRDQQVQKHFIRSPKTRVVLLRHASG